MRFVCLMLVIGLCFFSSTRAQKEIGTWKVKQGQLVHNDSHQFEIGKAYWEVVYNLLPQSVLDKYVVSLRLFTDGKFNDMGGVNQMGNTVEFWQFDLDTADMNVATQDSVEKLKYIHTLIHEFGHILTLNPEQIELTDDLIQDDAKGYLTTEGYAMKESYLQRFVNEFWQNKLLYAWDEINAIRNDRRRQNKLYDFYLNYKSQFVTDYAAHTPEEDIAESWTFFVLSDELKGSQVKYKKVRFFYQFPELVEYRKEIRSRLTSIPTNYLNEYRAPTVED